MRSGQELVVVSAVLPFPGDSGQQQRVRNTLLATREKFHVTFLTFAAQGAISQVENELREHVDEAVVLPALFSRNQVARLWHKAAGGAYSLWTGLKSSNYVTGRLELSPQRVIAALASRRAPDLALFEYWHTHWAARALRSLGTRCALDMHDLLWRSYDQQLSRFRWLPTGLRRRRVAAYRRQEQASWQDYDALVTINRDEHGEVASVLGSADRLIYAPMGIDLRLWPYEWCRVRPPRVVFYGGLGSAQNQQQALLCYSSVMPVVWASLPETELWIVGSNPPRHILDLQSRDRRVRVTGFVKDPRPLLAAASVMLCPFTGTYGFRSRVVEVLALGVPVVASPDATAGMDLEAGQHLLSADTVEGMARATLELLTNPEKGDRLSRAGRQRVEEVYSFEATYGALTRGLLELVQR
jgi:polysaccharide biosynthesis protein PslH